MPDKTVPTLPDAGTLAGTEYLYVAQGGTDAKLTTQTLINAARGGRQECQLLLSGGNLFLRPFNGNLLTINSKVNTIPDAGVSLGPGGTTVNQLYYVYAWMNGATMTLEASPTAYSV